MLSIMFILWFVVSRLALTYSSENCPMQDLYGEELNTADIFKPPNDFTSAKELFKIIDADSDADSYLTEPELREYFKKNFGIPDNSAQIISQQLMMHGDTDPQDGHLSNKEFAPAFNRMLRQMSHIFQRMADGGSKRT